MTVWGAVGRGGLEVSEKDNGHDVGAFGSCPGIAGLGTPHRAEEKCVECRFDLARTAHSCVPAMGDTLIYYPDGGVGVMRKALSRNFTHWGEALR